MNSYSMINRSLILCTLVLVLPVVALAVDGETEDTPALRITKIDGEISIDGVLDEESWKNAATFELNYEISPGENIKPLVKTVVYLMYDQTHVYAAFVCDDPDPSRIRAIYTKRDGFDGDWVCVNFDTHNDERRSISFSVNPLGVQWDAIRSSVSSASTSWDAIWDSAGMITPTGYVVEMAVPFSSMSFQNVDGEQIWGFDAWRNYPRDVNHRFAVVPHDQNDNCYHCQLVKIQGFENTQSGRNLEINPTLTTIRTDVRDSMPDGDFAELESESEAGITANWGITPNFNLGLTINPDFSQVEADALQLEINRQFTIYYPEKRPFFTEGMDYYNTCLNVVHTRNIVSPDYGLKLGGKEGANTYGVYYVEDSVTSIVFPGVESSSSILLDESNTTSILRYKRDFGSKSNIGLVYTGREGDGYHNRLFGIDTDLRLTQTDAIYVELYQTSTEYPDAIAAAFGQPFGSFDGNALVVEFYHDERNLSGSAKYWNLSDNFRTDLGEMPQTGFEYMSASLGYTWYADPGSWWSSFEVSGFYQNMNDQDGELVSRTYDVGLHLQADMQSSIQVAGGFNHRERYMGRYFDKNYGEVQVGFRPNKHVGIVFWGMKGDRIDYANVRLGDNIQAQSVLELEIGKSLQLGLVTMFDRLEVDDEHLYTANSIDMRMTYHFSRKMYFRAVLQYLDITRNPQNYTFTVEPEDRNLFMQLLYSYVINPRTVLYIGYSGNSYGNMHYSLTQGDRTVFAKLGYAWNL